MKTGTERGHLYSQVGNDISKENTGGQANQQILVATYDSNYGQTAQIYQTCWIIVARIWTKIKILLFVYVTMVEIAEVIKKTQMLSETYILLLFIY